MSTVTKKTKLSLLIATLLATSANANTNNEIEEITVVAKPTSYANIIGDEADTDFYVNVQGVHFLDGGPGNDRLYVQGSAEDYWKTEVTDGKTILFDRRADQNMTLHLENIEHIEFQTNPEQ